MSTRESKTATVKPAFSLGVARKHLREFFRVHHPTYWAMTDTELMRERMTFPGSQRSAICRAIIAVRRIENELESSHAD